MKFFKPFKIVYFITTAIVLLFPILSCNINNQKSGAAEGENENKFSNPSNKADAQFLVEAAKINLEEIRLGQMAQQKGESIEVQELGKMMVEAHSKALNDLNVLARKKSIAVPANPGEDGLIAYKELSDLTGSEFEKQYCNMMVNGHKDAIAAFEKAETEVSDMDIKEWVTSSLPDLRTHLDHAIVCLDKCKKMQTTRAKQAPITK